MRFIYAEFVKTRKNILFKIIHIAYILVITAILYYKTADPSSYNYYPKSVTFSNMLLCNSLAFTAFTPALAFFIYSSTIINEVNNDTFKHLLMCYSKSKVITKKFIFCTLFFLVDYIIIVFISGLEALIFNGSLSGLTLKTFFYSFTAVFLTYVLYGLYAFICSIVTLKYQPVVLLFLLYFLRNNIDNYINVFSKLFFNDHIKNITYHAFNTVNEIPNNTVACTIVPQGIGVSYSYFIIIIAILTGTFIFSLYTNLTLSKIEL